MKIFDLDILDRDTDNLYDFNKRTHNWEISTTRSRYVVQKSDEMRLDQICFNIYGSTEYIGFLMNYNNIDNPLNIKEGDEVLYVSEELIDLYKLQDSQSISSIEVNLPNRTTRKDKSRQSYLENSGQLPPTVLNRPTPSVTLNGNNIVIGRNTSN
jgi:hypothetical protein